MKKLVIGVAVILIGVIFTCVNGSFGAQQQATQLPPEDAKPTLTPLPEEGPAQQLMAVQPEPTLTPTDLAVQSAFQEAADEGKTTLLGLAIYTPVVERIQYSEDGSTALLWIGLRDPQTGEVIATEPGLAIERLTDPNAPQQSANWSVILQSNPSFLDQLSGLPPELLTDEIRARYLEGGEAGIITNAVGALTGYKLPWTAGVEKRLSGSIGHFKIYNSCSITSCRYAYDYADGTMFPLIASKGGTVKSFKWTCPNGSETCTNFLTLEDQSTVPTSYQVYYHLAYNSIPQGLRVVGAQVLQGQYIGDVDDTGYSTGHHLHYHVYTVPKYTDWSWGNSVDFIYDDVPINGGHPRTCYEASTWPEYGTECNAGKDGKRGTSDDDKFVSGNIPANPPVGTWNAPTDRLTLTSSTVGFSGSAADDIQIARIQVMANYDGTWKSAGDLTYYTNGSYSGSVDLCSTNIPDGPVALTVRIYDREGSQAAGIPVRQYIKNAACEGNQVPLASQCPINDNQVALYAEPDYRGACQVFNASGYTADKLTTIGENNAESIQVGKNVQALLYDLSSDVTGSVTAGRVETLEASDAGLGDNRIGANHVSGLWVQGHDMPPDEPFISPPGNRYDISENPTSRDSLVLSWKGGAGATAFDVILLRGQTAVLQTTTINHYLSVGSLTPGDYLLRVIAKNAAGANTSELAFTVDTGSLPVAAAASVPYSDSMENGQGNWAATGLWKWGSIAIADRTTTNAFIFNNGTDYADAAWKAGDLTSPPISLPAGTASYLRFLYYAGVEDDTRNWDQRRVQIAIGDGAFADLVQLGDDKQTAQEWLNSGPISLAAYAGLTVRLRFHFDAMDGSYNNFKGWMIDDVTVNSVAPNTSCADGDGSPSAIPTITRDVTVSGVICPEGDLDYFKFEGVAGQALLADIDARTLSPASSLDSYIYLLDGDRKSVLDENDDEEYSVRRDSLLSFTLTRTGTYYLKVKAWNHPEVGGASYTYNLTLRTQPAAIPPTSVQITYPNNPYSLPGTPFTITASASDYDGKSVEAVAFYWHGPDWSNPAWVKLGVDNTAVDGWKMAVQPDQYGGVNGSALYVQAVSKSGAVKGVVWWNVQTDRTPPDTQMMALPETTYSTVVNVQWNASDATGNLSYFELQYQVNGGAWQNFSGKTLTADMRSTWVEVPAGTTVGFRIRGVDSVGNIEDYQATAEAVTKIAPACTPDANEALGQSLASAVELTRGTMSDSYSLCTSAQNGSNDVDWMVFDAQQNDRLMLVAIPSGGAKLVFSLYSGTTTLMLVESWQSKDYNQVAAGIWNVPATGRYYLEIKAADPDMFGTDMRYRALVADRKETYFPSTAR